MVCQRASTCPTGLGLLSLGQARRWFGVSSVELQSEQRGFHDVEVVQQRLGILDVSKLGSAEVVLLTHVVVPVHALGEEPRVPLVVPRNGPQEGQCVGQVGLVVGVLVPLEIRQGRLCVFP